jgi:two-component system LytT family response regulator
MTMKALIVDDEKDVSLALKLLLNKTCPDIEVIGVVHSALDAVKALKKEMADILFLDIEMPGGNGFDLLEIVDNKELYVIFTTAHGEYAIKAIKNGAKDYILKPVDPDELINSVAKAKKEIESVKTNGASTKVSTTLSVSTPKGLMFVNKEDVIYIKADGRYSELHCKDEQRYTVCKNIGEYEEELNKDFFFRVHKSYLVNCKHVVKINSSDGGFVQMNNKSEIEISKRKKAEFLKFLK